nr:hypothetical protein [Tanacetum cinerariifolium]
MVSLYACDIGRYTAATRFWGCYRIAGSSSIELLTSEELDEEASRECMEEQAKNDAKQERMETSETTNVAEELFALAVDKSKGVALVAEQDSELKKKRDRPPSHIDGVRIYHKNRGISERIAKM